MKPLLFAFYSLLALLLCACGGRQYADIAQAEAQGATLGPRIQIDGVDVSGLSIQEAKAQLQQAQQAALQQRTYRITAGESSVDIPAGALSITYDTDGALLQALALPSPVFGGGVRQLSCQPSAQLEALRTALQELAAPLQIPPRDAVAQYDPAMEGGFRFIPDAQGREVDIPALAQALQQRIQNGDTAPLEAPCSIAQPAYTLEQARQDKQLRASFSTSFAGSTYGKANRVHNIKKAAACMDGLLLQSGETFDMNAVLGPRTAQNGWKTATGIRDGAYVQEYGGGVCQVSTTLYNAVLLADLPVVERHHHSWPLGYIDAGRDATISTGGPNFRFTNGAEKGILLSALVDEEEKTITVSIYGPPLPEGMVISLHSKKTATLDDPGVEYMVDTALAPGETQEVRKSRRGCIAVTWKEYYDAQGDLLKKEQVTEDTYRSIRGIIKTAG